MPKKFAFNDQVGLDCLEVKDINSKRRTCLNVLDQGTASQRVILVRDGGGAPTSRECLEAFETHWYAWTGVPRTLVLDRGLHHR